MTMTLLFGLTASVALTAALFTPSADGQGLPAVGQTAPGFSLTSQTGATVSLAGMHGKWVVVFFYPKGTDADSVAEAKSLQQDLPGYEVKNTMVVGISLDTQQAQQAFAAQAGITFPLLSDPGGKVASAYGSLGTLNGAPAASRNAFLIDPTGKIAQVWTNVTAGNFSAAVKTQLSVKPPITH